MNRQIFAEAGEWVVRHREGSLDAPSKRNFDAWLRESPHHVRAYLEMSSVWENLAALDPSWNISADKLIARAREDNNVYPLPEAPIGLSRGPTLVAGPTRKWNLLALAASLVVGIGIVSWLYLERNVHATDVGEQRTIVLEDGSSVELNALSRINVRFSEEERSIILITGQALFRVAKDNSRPFVVASGKTQVRAVGTEFDVYQKSAGTLVTVVEGRVAVIGDSNRSDWATRDAMARRAKAPDGMRGANVSSAVLVSAGQQILVGPGSRTAPQTANVEAATAWTQQRLVFESTPLAEVVEEFNRYNRRPLIIEDAVLRDFHVSGSFSSTDPTLLLRFLRAQPGITVDETASEILIARRSN